MVRFSSGETTGRTRTEISLRIESPQLHPICIRFSWGSVLVISIGYWWRRRESNPRPRIFGRGVYKLIPSFDLIRWGPLGTGTHRTSPLDISRPLQQARRFGYPADLASSAFAGKSGETLALRG